MGWQYEKLVRPNVFLEINIIVIAILVLINDFKFSPQILFMKSKRKI